MTLVIIPARMKSVRLPGKPLAIIGKHTLIEHCIRRVKEAGFEPIVATDTVESARRFDDEGGCKDVQVVSTGNCLTGTDRVFTAVEMIDHEGKHEFIINYQGDMPFMDDDDLRGFIKERERNDCDVLTAYCPVKIVECNGEPSLGWFSRMDIRSHIGLYGYKREALSKFVSLPQSPAEIKHSLEQLRAPEKFTWDFYEFGTMPMEVNTQADLDRARAICPR